MQAWEVPQAAANQVAGWLADFHLPADYPFLLVRVPVMAHSATAATTAASEAVAKAQEPSDAASAPVVPAPCTAEREALGNEGVAPAPGTPERGAGLRPGIDSGSEMPPPGLPTTAAESTPSKTKTGSDPPLQVDCVDNLGVSVRRFLRC